MDEVYLCVCDQHAVVVQIRTNAPSLLFDPVRINPVPFTAENMRGLTFFAPKSVRVMLA